MLASILVALTPFVLNALTQFTKVLAGLSSVAWIRCVLAVFAVIGVICANALTGSPIDVQSVSGLLQVALVSGAAFLSAHGSYHLLFKGSDPAASITAS